MSQRAPLVLASLAVAISILGGTSLGRATAASVAKSVPYAKTAGFARLADNSAKLNGRKSTLAGAPGTIPVVGPSGKLPASIGAVGPKGDKGDPGQIGPSNAYFAHGQSFTGLPAGDYVVFGELIDNNTTTSSGVVSVGPGLLDPTAGTANIPASSGSVPANGRVTIPFQGTVHLTKTSGLGANTATFGPYDIYWTVIKVGTLTNL